MSTDNQPDDGDDGILPINRRDMLIFLGASGVASTVGSATASAKTSGDHDEITAGTAALAQEYKLAEQERRLFVGPDSAKSNVSPNDGDLYFASDTATVYNGDGGGWSSIGTIGVGAFSDSGNDTDGGDDYQLPNAADNIDLQNDGRIRRADSIQTEDLDLKGDNAAPFMQNAVVAPLLDDPIYPLSNYADMAAATNQVLTDLDQSGIFAADVYLPPVRQLVGEAISYPANSSNWNRLPTLIGQEGQTIILPDSGFSDSNIIEVPANTSGVVGPTLIGISADDSNDRISGWAYSLLDQSRIKLIRCDSFIAGSGQSGCVRAEGVNSSSVDFMNVRDCRFTGFRGGQHGIKSSHGQFHMSGTDLSGSGGNPNGTCVEISDPTDMKNGNHISGWVSNADIGVKISNNNNSTNPSNGHYISVRAEKAGNSALPTPIDCRGLFQVTIQPKNAPFRQYRHSNVACTNVEWVTGAVREGYDLVPGGNAVNNIWATNGGVVKSNNVIELPDARIDCGGNKPFTNSKGTVPRIAPAFEGRVDPGGTPMRFGIVESRWSDWVGIYYNGNNYRARGVTGGSNDFDVDLGLSNGFNGEHVYVQYGGGDQCRFAVYNPNTDDIGFTVNSLSSSLTQVEPTIDAGGSTTKVFYATTTWTDDKIV